MQDGEKLQNYDQKSRKTRREGGVERRTDTSDNADAGNMEDACDMMAL